MKHYLYRYMVFRWQRVIFPNEQLKKQYNKKYDLGELGTGEEL